jgi:2-polyprenyl-6-hydroxyphenyl methylase/3-demethylubiquinone-9 3-methyltransferase
VRTPAPAAPPSPAVTLHADEVARGERFEFGRNWASFLSTLDEQRITAATDALARMLGTTSLAGRRFLDAGSGSGLSSLAAYRLGAEVLSFDFDPESVACTRELHARFADSATSWKVSDGSVLDREFLAGLGTFDVVYSWGVLHHTGHMWDALDAVIGNVTEGGQLFVAIYNDQGAWSHRWRRIKKLYCSGLPGRLLTTATIIPFWVGRDLMADLFWQRAPWTRYREYRQRRGMSVLHDWIDWLGGYPFEFAKPEAIVDFYLARGFTLERLRTVGGAVGCNEFVMRRRNPPGT